MGTEANAEALATAKLVSTIAGDCFPGAEVYLFGSCARGQDAPGSDIDVGVVIPSYSDYGPIELARREAALALAAFEIDDRVETVVREASDSSGMGSIIRNTGILVS